MLLRILNNMLSRDNTLSESMQLLQRRLPSGWRVEKRSPPRGSVADDGLKIQAPDKRSALLSVTTRSGLDPRTTLALLARLQEMPTEVPVLVVSRYLSASVRQRLEESSISYVDTTGNVHITLSEPGLFIKTEGADQDPNRKARPARSLRGEKAGRVVRMLIDLRTAPGVRELAARTGIDAGYVSRVIALLDTEALITRVGHGRIERVDWARLLRRWANEAPFESRGRVTSFIEPRGLPDFLARLTASEEPYAVTASLAAAQIAPVAPPRLATIYTANATQLADRLSLRPADSGANVLLVEPADRYVFERASKKDGIMYAAPSQVAADLLTGPGRAPAEAEALITWMTEHEEAWRG